MKLKDLQDYTLNKDYPLLPEQQEGVRFLVTRPRAILAFQTGLGKTYTSCTAMKHVSGIRDNIRGIIICPVNAIGIFERELKEKLGYTDQDIGFITTDRMIYDENVNKVFIFSYTAFLEYYSLIEYLKSRYILIGIIDEAHKIQSKDTKTREKMDEVKNFFSILWLITATPLLNDMDGLFNLVHYLDKNIFGSKTAFYNNYVNYRLVDIYIKGGGGRKKKVREVIGYKNLDRLAERLEKIAIVRQLQYNIKFARLWGELTEHELELYEKASAGILGGGEKKQFGARMHDLQRAVDNSYYSDFISNSELNTKERLLLESLTKIFEKNMAVLIYVDHHTTMNRLRVILKQNKDTTNYNKIYEITGSISRAEREYIEKAIQPRDIILITSAGSQSLNLQRANGVLFYDIPFSVGICIQIIGRITRADTKYDQLYVFLMYTKGTIDEYKYLLFLDRAYLIKKIFSSDATLPKEDLRAIDRENMDKLRDKYLWHYKKGGDRKLKSVKTKKIKERLICCTSTDYKSYIADYYINLLPLDSGDLEGTNKIQALCINDRIKDLLDQDEKLYPVVRSKYIDYLRKSKTAGKVLNSIITNICDKGKTIALVDDYKIGLIIKNFIIEEI